MHYLLILNRHVFGESDELIGDKVCMSTIWAFSILQTSLLLNATISQVEFCMKNGLNVILAISPKKSEPYSTFKLEQESFRQLSVVAPRVTDW